MPARLRQAPIPSSTSASVHTVVRAAPPPMKVQATAPMRRAVVTHARRVRKSRQTSAYEKAPRIVE